MLSSFKREWPSPYPLHAQDSLAIRDSLTFDVRPDALSTVLAGSPLYPSPCCLVTVRTGTKQCGTQRTEAVTSRRPRLSKDVLSFAVIQHAYTHTLSRRGGVLRFEQFGTPVLLCIFRMTVMACTTRWSTLDLHRGPRQVVPLSSPLLLGSRLPCCLFHQRPRDRR